MTDKSIQLPDGSLLGEFEPQTIFYQDTDCMEMILADTSIIWHLLSKGCHRVEVGFNFDGLVVGIRITGTSDIRKIVDQIAKDRAGPHIARELP